ncbi:outer membrane protein assembly factor BamA [Alistipes sp. An66]|uniref:outer membrane protein assembly factor BamA n=1 Tax=Alistipes sp. An66 TaxID=1965650 RepID=UPI000B39342C|nr:outer membrane protein assembly factor BamA [Alistipes sp. An66]OUN58607.1 outer membrane protein assembly factor BamA [Alistipes sp. An66]
MNCSRKIFMAAALLLLGCTNMFAQERIPQDSTAQEPRPAVPENAPMFKNSGEPKLYYIRKINVHGIKYLNPDVLKSSAGLIEGDSIYLPSNFIANAITRFWSQRFFSDVKIGAEIDGDSLDLEVFLKERPRVYNWAFEGISKGKQKDLLEKLKLKRGSELSDYVIDKNKKLIRDYWSEKGFRNTEVDVRIDNDTLRPGQAVNVTFLIDRKEKVKIGRINFIGNEQFKDKRLRRTFKKTHQKSINFFKGAKLNETDYEADKELLIDFYNSKGYRNANIVRDSIYPINEKRIGIDLEVSEGNKYYIRNVSWVGNSVYETDDLQRMFGVKTGDTYDKKTMHKRLGIGKETDPEAMSVSSLYQNEGYLMSQIEPAETIIGADSIDIEVKVFEGKQFTINNVGISGNQRVDDEVIRRELYTRPGELYNRSLLMQTIRTLGSMGHFNPEAIMPDIKPVTNELVDINWPLEEQASDQFNIAGGWGSGTFVGSVGITLNNLSVKNFFKKGAWRPYPMGQNQRLSLSAQTNGTYYKAFALSFTDPWLGGKKPNSFTFSAHISEQNNAYYVWQTATQYFRTYGVAAGLGKRLNWPDPYFTFYAEASYERYNLKNWTGFVVENGNSNLLSLKLVFGRNSVDQPIYPRRGSEFSASVQATLPYSLWDGKDYSDQSMSDQDRYRWIEFHKWQFKAQWFQGFLNNSNLVLMLKAEMGYLGSYNKNKVSPFQRYEVGGDGMTGYNIYGIDIIGMRGYEDGALDPSNYYSRGYNKYTAELRYPIILKPSSQIYVLGFLEGGNAFDSWKEFSPFKIKRSAGFGVRLYLPVVGMLGIDWGYGFDPPANSTTKSGSQFHFVLGQQF